VIDLEVLVEHRVEGKRSPITLRSERVGRVAVRRDEPGAIHLDLTVFANQAEFHREPKEARHASGVLFVLRRGSDLSIVLEKIREDGIRVERHVAKNVVEDVRLGQVIQLAPLSDGDRRRKLPERQALKKALGRDVARHRNGFPASRRSEPAIHFGEIGNGFLLEADGIGAFQEYLAAVLPELVHAPLVQQAPHLVVVFRVRLPVLLDEDGRIVDQLVKCGG